MEITYMIVVSVVTYILGAIIQIFVNNVPSKYIPIKNVIIGLISACICYWFKIETNFLQAVVLCLISASAADSIIIHLKNNKKDQNKKDKE